MANFGQLTGAIRSRSQKFKQYLQKAIQREAVVLTDISIGAKAIAQATKKFFDSFGKETARLNEISQNRLNEQDSVSQYKMRDRAVAEITQRTKEDIKLVVEDYARGRLRPEQFKTELQAILRAGSLAVSITGVVGIGNLTENVLTASQRQLTAEFATLDGFINELSTREMTQRDRARALMYANALHSISQTANRQFTLDTYGDPSALEERRVLGSAEHCEDCEALAAEGWVNFGSLPPIGTGTVCRNNCHCTIITRLKTDNNQRTVQPVPEAEG